MCLIGPRGSDKYNPRDLQLLLWISMLIGFQLDLTDLTSPQRGTASSQGRGGVYGGKQRVKKGEIGERKQRGLNRSRRKEVWRSIEDSTN